MEFHQTIAQQSLDSYDFVRTLRMAGYGLLVLGPSLHFWFNFMSKLFPKRDLLSTLKKMAMGQGIYGPTMTVVFFSLNARLQGTCVLLFNEHFFSHIILRYLFVFGHSRMVTSSQMLSL